MLVYIVATVCLRFICNFDSIVMDLKNTKIHLKILKLSKMLTFYYQYIFRRAQQLLLFVFNLAASAQKASTS